MWFLSNILCGNLRSLQAQAGASLEENSSAGEPSAQSKSSLTVVKFSCGGRTKATLNLSPSGMMCERSTDAPGMDLWMSSVAASRAKTFLPQGAVMGLKVSEAGFGERWRASLARYDPASRSWKIARHLFGEDLAQSSETWPRWGMTQGGELYPLETVALHTPENEYGLLPTPLKPEGLGWKQSRKADPRQSIINVLVGGHQLRWIYFPLWHHSTPLQATELAEWMMGWPRRWTDLNELETAKFQSWLQQHGAF